MACLIFHVGRASIDLLDAKSCSFEIQTQGAIDDQARLKFMVMYPDEKQAQAALLRMRQTKIILTPMSGESPANSS